MEVLKQCLPELRHVLYDLDADEREVYIKNASPLIIQCINEIVINLLYSHKNGIKLNRIQLDRLRNHQTQMKKYVLTKTVMKKRKLLKNNLLTDLLTTIIEVVNDLEIEI